MTMPVAPPRPPVRLADLGAARVEWARSRRKGVVSYAVFWCLLSAQSLFFVSISSGLVRTLWWAVPIAIISLAPAVALDRWMDRRAGAPAAPGPSSLTTMSSSAAGPAVWASVLSTLTAEGFQSWWRVDDHTISARRSHVWRTGQLVSVRVVPAAPGMADVTVWSRSESSPWVTADLGRARRDANAVLRALPGVDAPAVTDAAGR